MLEEKQKTLTLCCQQTSQIDLGDHFGASIVRLSMIVMRTNQMPVLFEAVVQVVQIVEMVVQTGEIAEIVRIARVAAQLVVVLGERRGRSRDRWRVLVEV